MLVLVHRYLRAPDGHIRVACRWCGSPAQGRFVYYCSAEHADSFDRTVWESFDWGGLRAKALKRDKNRCVNCGDGPESPTLATLEASCSALLQQLMGITHQQRQSDQTASKRADDLRRELDLIEEERERRARLEVDHIIAVAEDPTKEFDLDNLRTLCWSCHILLGAKPNAGRKGVRSIPKLDRFEHEAR